MSAIEWPDVVLVAAELACVREDDQREILSRVNAALRPDDWGGEGSEMLHHARVFLAAHMTVLAARLAKNPGAPRATPYGNALVVLLGLAAVPPSTN